MSPHHKAWLDAHPERDAAWLRAAVMNGMEVHHIDGDHGNDAHGNLVLIDGADHRRLHEQPLFVRPITRPTSWADEPKAKSKRPRQPSEPCAFQDLLRGVGMTKETLARVAGVKPASFAGYGKSKPVPVLLLAYLEALRRNKQLEAALIIERERRP